MTNVCEAIMSSTKHIGIYFFQYIKLFPKSRGGGGKVEWRGKVERGQCGIFVKMNDINSIFQFHFSPYIYTKNNRELCPVKRQERTSRVERQRPNIRGWTSGINVIGDTSGTDIPGGMSGTNVMDEASGTDVTGETLGAKHQGWNVRSRRYRETPGAEGQR